MPNASTCQKLVVLLGQVPLAKNAPGPELLL